MKTFKMLCVTAFMLATIPNAFAQIQSIAFGGGLSMPSGSFGDVAGTGFNGNVRLTYHYEDFDQILFTGMIGYHRFGAKEWLWYGTPTGVDYKWTLIPVMTGGRYYFGDEETRYRFWAGAEIGVHIYSVSLRSSGGSVSYGNALSGSTDFALQPMAGISLGALDVYAYLSISDFNYLGLQAAFKLPLGER